MSDVDVSPRVALSRQGEHRIRARVHDAVNVTREMHTQEREGRIGHRVDESLDQARAFRAEQPILTAEGDDSHVHPSPGPTRHLVAVKPTTVEQRTGSQPSAGRVDPQADRGCLPLARECWLGWERKRCSAPPGRWVRLPGCRRQDRW